MIKNRIKRFPLYVPAANLQISSFPPLAEEESWKIHFTADESSGKAAISSFPPLIAEEDWKIQFTADESSGKAAISSFPPL